VTEPALVIENLSSAVRSARSGLPELIDFQRPLIVILRIAGFLRECALIDDACARQDQCGGQHPPRVCGCHPYLPCKPPLLGRLSLIVLYSLIQRRAAQVAAKEKCA